MPIDPFSPEGAKRIAEIAGQQPAPMSATVLSAPALPSLPQPTYTPMPTAPIIPDLADLFKDEPSELEGAFLRSTIDSAETQGELAQESAFRAQQEQALDISGKKKTITDLTNRFNTLKAEADQIPLRIQNEFEGRGATAGGVAPIETGRLRETTIQQIGISAMLNAANGNLSTALDQVESAVKAKFEPLRAQLAAEQAQLAAITPLLEREDRKRAEARSAALTERARLLSKQEADQRAIYETMLTAAQYGADAVTLRKIQSAATPQEAASAAANVLGTKFRTDEAQREFDNEIKLAQLAIDQRKATADSVAVSDPAQLLAYAQQFAATGKIPTGIPKGGFGLVSQLAKELPKQEGTLIDSNTGVKPDISDAKIDGLATLYDISQKVEQLKELDQKRWKGVIPATVGKIFGSANQQRYVDLRTEIVDLLSRARTGAALTASEEKFYADQLPGRVSNFGFFGADSQLRIDNFASKIQGTLNAKLKANQAAIVGFSKVNVAGQSYTVGQIVENAQGQKGRVNADGTVTLIQ